VARAPRAALHPLLDETCTALVLHGRETQKAPRTAVQLVNRDCISVDIVGDTTVLTNIVTHEQVCFPGHWAVLYDNDGCFGTVHRSDEDQADEDCRDLDSVFTKAAYRAVDSDLLYIVETVAGEVATVPLEHLVSVQRHATVQLRDRVSAGVFSMSVYVFKRPRAANQRCFWNLHDVYKYLLLTAYNNQPSKWLHACSPSWLRHLKAVIADELLVFGTYLNDTCSARLDMPWAQRCLPTSSLATCGLLAMLARWAYCPPATGGMNEARSRAAACELMMTMLSWTIDVPEDIFLRLLLVPSWNATWPRPAPLPDTASCIVLVMQHGELDLQPLVDAATGQRPHNVLARSWLRALGKTLNLRETLVPVLTFLMACTLARPLASLSGQLMWWLSLELERRLAQTGMHAQSLGRLTFAFCGCSTECRLFTRHGPEPCAVYCCRRKGIAGSARFRDADGQGYHQRSAHADLRGGRVHERCCALSASGACACARACMCTRTISFEQETFA